jgi:adenylosuccinate synthase
LHDRFEARVFSSRALLQRIVSGVVGTRAGLQEAGERLDRETSGIWLAEAFAQEVAQSPGDAIVVLDAVRVSEQVSAIRELLGPRVVHIHLQAPVDVLAGRYAEATSRSGLAELGSYEQVTANPTEASVDELAVGADIVVDTERSRPEDVLVQAASQLGLYGRGAERLVDVLVGGQWGSEGKGNIAHALAPEYDLLVRVGGPNAGHRVPWSGGAFTHHALPSGTGATDAQLLLGPGAVINPQQLLDEIVHAEVPVTRLTIDEQATVIMEDDPGAEESLVRAIGSTGQGVGAATARRILARDIGAPLARDVDELKPYLGNAQEVLEDAYARGWHVLLEGTQGTGLSLYHGQYPHVTSRDTTIAGVMSGAGIGPTRVRHTVMVCRTYPIRVQNPDGATSGPMGREIDWATVARRSGIDLRELEDVEQTSTTNRRRRVAEFDWVQLRRSTLLNDPTDIALTFIDYLEVSNRHARRFEQLTPSTIRFIEEVERVAGAPVSLISTRFGLRSVIDRRAWARVAPSPQPRR